MSNNLKNVLITGGAGFIGSHLADALLAEGYLVRILDNLSTGNLANLAHIKERITFYHSDIRDSEILTKAVDNCDFIFHQAAVVSVPQTVADPIDSATVNDMGTLMVLETARKKNVKRVVIASSCAVYGDDPQIPKYETMTPKPLSPYAVQKLTGEFYARLYHDLYHLETVSLRYFNVYGPRQDPSSPYSGVISLFMSRAVSERQPVIYGDGEQYRDFIFVKDVVRANLLAATAENVSGNVFNVGTGNVIRINQLWEMICQMSGLAIEPQYSPPRKGDIRESMADITHTASALRFSPEFSFEKGLKSTFEWYRGVR